MAKWEKISFVTTDRPDDFDLWPTDVESIQLVAYDVTLRHPSLELISGQRSRSHSSKVSEWDIWAYSVTALYRHSLDGTTVYSWPHTAIVLRFGRHTKHLLTKRPTYLLQNIAIERRRRGYRGGRCNCIFIYLFIYSLRHKYNKKLS